MHTQVELWQALVGMVLAAPFVNVIWFIIWELIKKIPMIPRATWKFLKECWRSYWEKFSNKAATN